MPTQPPVIRSSFVTGLSWFSIVLSGFAILVGVVQALFVFLAFKAGSISFAFEEVTRSGELFELPAVFQWMIANIRLVALLPLILGWVSLVVSVGLLKRKNWARISFIALLVISTLATLVGTISFWGAPAPFELPDGEPYVSGITKLVQTMHLLFVVLNLATVALHAWLAWRLTRPSIRREFEVESGLISG